MSRPALASSSSRDNDDAYLRDHGHGLFPDGIKSLRPDRLYLAARVELTSRHSIEHKGPMSERILEDYRIQVLMGDEGFHHSIITGELALHFMGPQTGLYLANFDNHDSFFIDTRHIWECIARQGRLVDPRKYMVSVLRGFIQTHLLKNRYLTDQTTITLVAVAGRNENNDQVRLVNYYRTLGFLPAPKRSPGVMQTTIKTFIHYTKNVHRWAVDMSKLQGRYIQMPPDPNLWSHTYPMTRIDTTTPHIGKLAPA